MIIMRERENVERGRHSIERLSPREKQVLEGIARGLTNKEIGLELGISHRTVEVHRAKLMRKLNVTNLASLLAIAFSEHRRLSARRGG